jgi:hypothetical protein
MTQKMNIQTGMEIGRRLSWCGIFAGLLLALATQITLSFLGSSFGLMTVSPFGALPMGITVGAGIWWVFTMITAYFIGGWVAGHLRVFSTGGAIHGIGTWAATTVVSILLMTVLFGSTSAVGTAALNSGVINNPLMTTPGVAEQQADIENARPSVPSVREMPAANQSPQTAMVRNDIPAAKHAAAKTAFWAFLASLFGALSAAWGGAWAASGRDFASEYAFREWEHREAA